ncbi:glycosyltransferase family 39 protein [Acidocella sp.]|uniref:glycosyltransferase family 39 protein n=1 Tax=Acidocella sp. TaxID=50710 RepID=UPI003D04C829
MSISTVTDSATRTKTAARARLAAWAWPAGVFILALLPRLIDLGKRPFWLDEVFTFNRASLKPGALVLDSFQNHHMPGFFLLLAPFTHLPHPEFWLRLPSALFGALAVVLVFIIASRVAGRLAGMLAALILGLSPTILAFAQEARSYTLVMTLILVALYGVTRLALDPQMAGRGMRAAKAGWLCFVFGTAAALDVLGDALPWLLAANLIFLCLMPFVPERGRFLRTILLADLAVILLTAPLYVLMLHFQSESVTHSLGWIPPLSLERVWYNFGAVYLMHVADWVSYRLLSHHALPGLVWLIDALLLVALGAALWRLRRRPALLVTLGIALLFLPGLFLLISIWHPVLLPRYLLWSAAPFAILTGIGAAALLETSSPRIMRLAVLGAAALLLANLLPYYLVETKPRWDLAARMLAREVGPGDMLYFSDTGAVPILKLYMSDAAQATVLASPYGGLAQAKQALSQGRRVWVVYGHAGQNTSTPRSFFKDTQALGMPSEVQQAGKRITIALFDPSAHLASCTPLEQQDGICG